MRHAGVLSALLVTAALLCAMPGLARLPVPQGRADERLRPPQLRTLVVWLIPGETDDRKLISRLCSAYEKEQKGTRIFLRVVTAEELMREQAVLPHVTLFDTGSIVQPESCFCALTFDAGSSGCFAGVQRAVPLWLTPNVLSIPDEWLNDASPSAQRTESLLAASTAAPETEERGMLLAQDAPWEMLLQNGAVVPPRGVGWQQLLNSCPSPFRARLVHAVLHPEQEVDEPALEPEEWVTTLPRTQGTLPTPVPAVSTPARVETLASHQARVKAGEALTACILTPAVSDRVRYAAVCQKSAEAMHFLQFLQDQAEEALQYGLLPVQQAETAAASPEQELLEAFRSSVLPNAFAHTREEIDELCADGFARCADPVGTLIRLR